MKFSHFLTSKKSGILAFFAVFFAFLNASAQNHDHDQQVDSAAIEQAEIGHHESHEEKEFDITSFIFHHIGDSHEFHFWGHGESWTGLYLPVILYTHNGLVCFSAKEFHLNDDGSVVVEKDGMRFARSHGKIYYAAEGAEHGSYVHHEKNAKGEEVVTNLRPIDFSITKNVFTLFLSVAILLLVFLSVAKGYKKREGKAPKGLQSVLEPIIIFVRDDIAKPNLGHKYERYMPYLLTVFFFIWLNNMLGLVPFFPGGANVTGNIAVTMILALFTLLIILFSGNKYYWGHIFNPPVPWWLKPLMIPVEIFGIFTKPFALMIRLFANITAGHILVLSLLCLVFIFKSLAVAPVSVFFVVFIGAIELLVAFIQAFIFTILSALFIGMAIEEHADH
ncbi:F0F1 ATP synthase subunit A [Olivibacter sp. XZL3]|uniref:F0F1 ATP synthase subunit A n=1 Tax=Olivibacter sp. XZL3 TaxID=1735116 RepID=UPI0010658DFC|nr:F0F1 ATP synthase subunit A [Olivibacter sp. XZL3]